MNKPVQNSERIPDTAHCGDSSLRAKHCSVLRVFRAVMPWTIPRTLEDSTTTGPLNRCKNGPARLSSLPKVTQGAKTDQGLAFGWSGSRARTLFLSHAAVCEATAASHGVHRQQQQASAEDFSLQHTFFSCWEDRAGLLNDI